MATTRTSVENARTQAVETARSAGGKPSQAEISNTQTPEAPQTDKDTVKLDDMTAEQQVAHFDSIAKQRDLTDDERKQQEAANDALNDKKKKFNAGKVDGSFRDPEWPDREKSKFDIQQGDFIEFLMKDVVLAGAAEAGDKVFGMVGTGIYRGTSWGYHKLFDNNKAAEAAKKAEEARKKAEAEALKRAMLYDDPKKIEIKDGDDKTTVMTKKIRQFRMDMIPYNEINYYQDEIKSLIAKALSKDWNPKNLSAEEKALMDKYGAKLEPQLNELNRTVKAKDYNPELVENISKDASHLVSDHIVATETVNVIAANYAGAALMNSMAKDPGRYEGKSDRELEKLFKFYALQGKKICLTEMKKIYKNNPDKTFTDVTEMLESSRNAVREAISNMENGNYQEKGKQPSTQNQEAMDRVWQKIHNRDQWGNQEDKKKEKELLSLQEEANNLRGDYLKKQFEETLNKEISLQNQREENDKKRKPADNPEKGKDKPNTPTPKNRANGGR